MKGRKTLNKKRKQGKTRKTKKNRIRPIIYGGASIKQYGVASALRSLILTYFPQRNFEIIKLYNPEGYDKYGLTTKYTTVMELLNQIVHNDDDRAVYSREVKFGDFLIYSQDLDTLFIDIISDIKQYFYEPKISDKISRKKRDQIQYLIDSIDRELEKNMGVVEEGLPKMIKAEAQAIKQPANLVAANLAAVKVKPGANVVAVKANKPGANVVAAQANKPAIKPPANIPKAANVAAVKVVAQAIKPPANIPKAIKPPANIPKAANVVAGNVEPKNHMLEMLLAASASPAKFPQANIAKGKK